jgi:hypothetical protein
MQPRSLAKWVGREKRTKQKWTTRIPSGQSPVLNTNLKLCWNPRAEASQFQIYWAKVPYVKIRLLNVESGFQLKSNLCKHRDLELFQKWQYSVKNRKSNAGQSAVDRQVSWGLLRPTGAFAAFCLMSCLRAARLWFQDSCCRKCWDEHVEEKMIRRNSTRITQNQHKFLTTTNQQQTSS